MFFQLSHYCMPPVISQHVANQHPGLTLCRDLISSIRLSHRESGQSYGGALCVESRLFYV